MPYFAFMALIRGKPLKKVIVNGDNPAAGRFAFACGNHEELFIEVNVTPFQAHNF